MEFREIQPAGRLNASVSIPGSKSHTQRALVIAALAEGRSVLRKPLLSEDTGYLIEGLRSLGVAISQDHGDLFVNGTGGLLRNPGREIYLGNNGTGMRFLTTLVCLGPGTYRLTGDPRLCERPMGPLLEALSSMGAEYRCLNRAACLPLEIRAGSLSGGTVRFGEIESSQYISSIMLAAPFARQGIDIEIEGAILSKPYVDMTIQNMEEFGVKVIEEGAGRFVVPSGRSYRGREYEVEPDASSSSYFFLAAALCGGSAKVLNLNPRSRQGDLGFLDILEQTGCTVIRDRESIEVRGGPPTSGEMTFPMAHIPDMVPTVAALAACRPGRTIIEKAAHLRYKESDRLAAIAAELAKTDIRVEERAGGLVIEGGAPRGAEIETYNDHRIAMSFAVLGLAVPGMKIANPDCVKKSFPGFWEELEKLYP
ncbi:MAG: 3-phosphoshikimate 1-carboxyvinyltransferase [Desulfobacteraceae bacterium]|nr:MAG: 3-phosphoshikimate 1-carboxyvinyltransferase [Desulfobacteraceae bacterium]